MFYTFKTTLQGEIQLLYLGNITVEDRCAWATFLDVAWVMGYMRFVFFFYLSLINQKLVMKVVARHKSTHKSAVWHSNLFVLHILSTKNDLGLMPIYI